LHLIRPTTAFLGTMYIGTDVLGRPLTADESKQLGSVLRKHDFEGASMIALNFAFKRTRNKAVAQDLLGRSHVRLVRQGWDPSRVTLPKCLCRFVWSEHGNMRREDRTRREAEQGFLREQGLSHASTVEDYARRLDEEKREEEQARRRTEQLRASFVQAGDTVNLLWLDYWLDGIEEPMQMARLSGRPERDFYLAADRRKRHVSRLMDADGGETSEEKK
jgi:hypothetical protein